MHENPRKLSWECHIFLPDVPAYDRFAGIDRKFFASGNLTEVFNRKIYIFISCTDGNRDVLREPSCVSCTSTQRDGEVVAKQGAYRAIFYLE